MDILIGSKMTCEIIRAKFVTKWHVSRIPKVPDEGRILKMMQQFATNATTVPKIHKNEKGDWTAIDNLRGK